jgi:hypothetical protein
VDLAERLTAASSAQLTRRGTGRYWSFYGVVPRHHYVIRSRGGRNLKLMDRLSLLAVKTPLSSKTWKRDCAGEPAVAQRKDLWIFL